MSVSTIATIDSPAFAAGIEHRRALVLEVSDRDLDSVRPGWRAKYAAYYGTVFARGDAALLAYDVEGEIAGSCIVSVLDEFRRTVLDRGIGYVNAMFVLERFRGRAIAAELLDAAVAWAKARGCAAVRLHPSPLSRAFYQRHGFQPIDEYELRLDR